MQRMDGYSLIDVLAATAVIFIVCAVIVLIANPFQDLKEQYDRERDEAVKDLTEALLQYQNEHPEAFEEDISSVISKGRTMVGAGGSCVGSFGIQCDDAVLSNECIDLDQLLPTLREGIPVDPSRDFTEEHTGYFIVQNGNNLTVGACNPESRSNIEITSTLNDL